MFDLDPRDYDSRDDDRHASAPSRGTFSGAGDRDRDDDKSRPGARPGDRNDEAARTLGRGPSDERQGANEPGRDRNDDSRWAERDRDVRERDREVRDAFSRHIHLPRGPERELVRDRDREYTLRGSESRTLATVGAFRVVSSRDLRDQDGGPADPRSGDLRHLREQGLIETARVPGYRDQAVTLTSAGRSLLECHRDLEREHQQTFYRGLVRQRELEHDLQLYRAYEQAETRLLEHGAHIERVVLDHELKSEYQRWLHERDRDHDDYDGHPDRTPDEIRDWAYQRHLRDRHTVTRLTREMGIRIAVGATDRHVLKLVLGQALILSAIGIGAGVLTALMVTPFLVALLYGVGPADPVTFAIIRIVLLGVALAAGYLPARRAIKIDPTVALRTE